MNANAELTDFLNSESRKQLYGRTLENILRRASTLWEDGYTAAEELSSAHFRRFTVRAPEGGRYLVCISDTPNHDVFGSYCTCPAFPKYGECKHRAAVTQFCKEGDHADREYEQAEELKNFYGFDRSDY